MNEQNFKNYFLGKLSEAEGEALEEKIASDTELTEKAQIVESELIDDYLRDNLSAPEKKLFEAIYLITEARREKLWLAKSLWKVANEQKSNEIVFEKTPNSLWQIWNAWRVAFVGFAALLLLGALAFFWINLSKKEEVVQQQNTNQSPMPKVENRNIQPIETANSINRNVNISPNLNKNISPTPTPKTLPTPKPSEQPAPVLASFVLSPGTFRSDGEQFIKIVPNTKQINIRLKLPAETAEYQKFRAVIKTADGATVSTFSNLKSLNLNLPAEKLENRTYIIFLEGISAENQPESITEYTFRIKK